MKLNKPYLIISLNENKIIFFVVSYDENKDYKLIKNIIIDSNGIQNGKIIDIQLVVQIIKKIPTYTIVQPSSFQKNLLAYQHSKPGIAALYLQGLPIILFVQKTLIKFLK